MMKFTIEELFLMQDALISLTRSIDRDHLENPECFCAEDLENDAKRQEMAMAIFTRCNNETFKFFLGSGGVQ